MALPQPVPSGNFADTWQFLEEGLNRILAAVQGGVSYGGFMELYTVVYNHLTQTHQSGFQTNAFATSAPDITRGSHHRCGSELYAALRNYLRNRLRMLREAAAPLTGPALLAFYSKEWQQYERAATFIDHIFRYMNRYWIRRQREERRTEVYDIYTLCLVLWYRDFFLPLEDRVVTTALDQIVEKRRGKTIDSEYIRDLASSLVYINVGDGSRHDRMNAQVYKEAFNSKFIQTTRSFYTQESDQYRTQHSIVDYLKQAEMWIQEEEQWCERFLPKITLEPLQETCNVVLIESPLPAVCQEFSPLLKRDATDDLARIYRLLSRLHDGLKPLLKAFMEHVKDAGLAAVDALARQITDNVDSRRYTHTLLTVHTKFNEMVKTTFNSDPVFVVELDKACNEFINRNAICKPGGTVRTPELLARYTDALLRRGNKGSEAGSLEEDLQHLMTVFKYIDDKDVFQKFYTKMLAKRLVYGLSLSEDAELNMMSKLKVACGHEYTSKIHRMFLDISLSRTFNDQFKDHMSSSAVPAPQFEYKFLVLGTSSWPLQGSSSPLRVPDVVAPLYREFQAFYVIKHSGRKLQWLFQHSIAEIRARINPARKVTYILQASTYQMAILMLYNQADAYSFEELVQHTGMNEDTLTNHLSIFLRFQLLRQTKGDKVGTPNSRYELNTGFAPKKHRINLNIPVKSEQKQETEATNRIIAKDREYVIKAALVRIMKARKQMDHGQLINEVITLLQSRFRPQIPDIKKVIDELLDQDFIERTEGQKNIYNYIA
ncbi:ubiquitin ligase (cullin) of SCF [Dispira parvispora]|uniref:Ubiquitin ligase (Cullin) of SCF n=1 Tax=Dispira parvispora TaxID=1520584 RepID=A0A9W8E873_9FUNG|nr:ubiquitin ligase (cullin) of SCF [Dispira parvispora]